MFNTKKITKRLTKNEIQKSFKLIKRYLIIIFWIIINKNFVENIFSSLCQQKICNYTAWSTKPKIFTSGSLWEVLTNSWSKSFYSLSSWVIFKLWVKINYLLVKLIYRVASSILGTVYKISQNIRVRWT